MKDYLLFIDTETSGLPKRWDLPYSNSLNWPFAVQIAWIVYTSDGQEVTRQNEYIYEKDIVIGKDSIKIHGITEKFITQRGKRRKDVLRKLAYDIKKYNPLIIGHFIELDIHVLSADYERAKLKNPFHDSCFFCTMLKSHAYSMNPSRKYLKLADLYEFLFHEYPAVLHHAEKDAVLAADCFFEILRREEIDTRDIELQKKHFIAHLNLKEEVL